MKWRLSRNGVYSSLDNTNINLSNNGAMDTINEEETQESNTIFFIFIDEFFMMRKWIIFIFTVIENLGLLKVTDSQY